MISLQEFEKHLSVFKNKINSQLGQDALVLFLKNFKKGGFFVEFGSCDGVHLSNTLLLETDYQWTGILAEPSKNFYPDILNNRTCIIDNRAVFSESNLNLEFSYFPNQSDISGITDSFVDGKMNKKRKKELSETYTVSTISLEDLLNEHNAPKNIDYLSIDTEGTEFSIIQNFNFSNYFIDIITIEHNYNVDIQNNIKNLLESNNFVRILESHSKWDDWYVSKTFLNGLTNA